jgi:hypothetical protein
MNIKYLFSAGLLILMLFLSCTAFAEGSIVGYWLSTSKSKGDMASMLEFRNDGTVSHTMSIMRDYQYSIVGNILTLRHAGKPDTGKDVLFATFNDNELTLKQSIKDAWVTLRRVNEGIDKNKKGIIGKWFHEDQNAKGKIEYYIFTKEGFMFYRLPMPGSTVTNYIIKGDTLEMSRKDMKSTNAKWNIKDGYLTLSSEEGKEWTYKRSYSQEETTAQPVVSPDRLRSR